MKTFREYLEEAEMDPRTALQIFGLADFPKTESELKQLYKKLAMQNHPDRGGSLEKMKDINLANEVLKRNIGRSIGNSYGGSGRTGSMSGNARAYRRAGSVFTQRAKPNASRPKSEEEMKHDEMCDRIRKRILRFFAELDSAGIAMHLKNIVGQDFTFKVTNWMPNKPESIYSKAPWIKTEFFNADRSIVFWINLTGNTDGNAYRMRNLPGGAALDDDFDFEWTYAVDLDYGGHRHSISKAKKCRIKDIVILQTPEKILPKRKVADSLNLSGTSASARKTAAVKAKKKDFEAVFNDPKLSETITTGKWRFIKFRTDRNGFPCYLAIERITAGGIGGWIFRSFARAETVGKKTTMKLYGKEMLTAANIALPDTKDCVAFFANLISYACVRQNEKEIAAYANKYSVKLLEPK